MKYDLITEDIQTTDNYYIRKQQSISDIPADIVNLFIYRYGNSMNQLEFPQSFHKLKGITIGNECFQHVREFVLDGLVSLESIKIGENCFGINKKKEYADCLFRIMNCPTLKQLEIGNNSFRGYSSFILSRVKSLQTIHFSEAYFPEYRQLVIDDVFGMKTMNICNNQFSMSWIDPDDDLLCYDSRQLVVRINNQGIAVMFQLSDTKYLQSIEFGKKSFQNADCSLKSE